MENLLAKDLRIGNLVNELNVGIISIDIVDLEAIKNGDTNYQPIPLTYGWMSNLPNEFIFIFPKNFTYPKWIKYVHELQNWYYWNNEKKELLCKANYKTFISH